MSIKTRSMRSAFRNERGAVDLASIMVGIIVLGIIAGVIAAVVFAVIPWSQRKAATEQLNNIATAQSAYLGWSAESNGLPVYAGLKPDGSGDAKRIMANNDIALFDGSNADIFIYSNGVRGDNADYTAYVKSGSGESFAISKDNVKRSVPKNVNIEVSPY